MDGKIETLTATEAAELRRQLAHQLADLDAHLAVVGPQPAPPATLLTPEEAGKLAGVEAGWLVRYGRTHKSAWLRKLGHKTVRIDSAAFTRWLASRRPQ